MKYFTEAELEEMRLADMEIEAMSEEELMEGYDEALIGEILHSGLSYEAKEKVRKANGYRKEVEAAKANGTYKELQKKHMKYDLENPEKAKARKARWYAANKEKIAAKRKAACEAAKKEKADE